MARQYCEAYRGWHVWFEPDGGYVIWDDITSPYLAEGYYSTREAARRDIDWYLAKRAAEIAQPDTPSLDQPWWHFR